MSCPKKERLSWPDAIRNPEENGEGRGGGGYNGQNEIVLGQEGTFARVFIEPDTPRFCRLVTPLQGHAYAIAGRKIR